MGDVALSQDEIDALLNDGGSGSFDMGPVEVEADQGGVDALHTVLAPTVDPQAANLATLTQKAASLSGLSGRVVTRQDLLSGWDDEFVQISMDYRDGLDGEHGFILPSNAAERIATHMQGQDGNGLSDAALSAVQEAFSNMNGPVSTAIGDAAGGVTIIPAPAEAQLTTQAGASLPDGSFLAFDYTLTLAGEQLGTYVEYFAASIGAAVGGSSSSDAGGIDLNQFDLGGGSSPGRDGGQMGGYSGPGSQQNPMMGAGGQMNMGGQASGQGMQGMGMQQNPMMGMQGMGMQQNPMMGMPGMGMPGMGGGPSVQSVQFPSFGAQEISPNDQGNIGLLMDVNMEMTVELGRTRKPIRDILGMGEGTIIELDKLAGEPVDILVNHKLIAKGEVVVIDENFGVRVTEIISPAERVNNMT